MIFIWGLFACNHQDEKVIFKSFVNYPNGKTQEFTRNGELSKGKRFGDYFWIKNAPENEKELLRLTKKFIKKQRYKSKLKGDVEYVLVFFYTDKPGFFGTKLDENYISQSDGRSPEDEFNPRRIEYVLSRNLKGRLYEEYTLYKNEEALLPEIIDIERIYFDEKKTKKVTEEPFLFYQ